MLRIPPSQTKEAGEEVKKNKWYHFVMVVKGGVVDTFWDGKKFKTIKTGQSIEIWIPPVPTRKKVA